MHSINTKSKAYIAIRKILGDHRKIFETSAESGLAFEQAIATLRRIVKDADYDSGIALVVAGIGAISFDDEGNIVPPTDSWENDVQTAFGAEDTKVGITFIGTRGATDEATGKAVNGALGLAIYPLYDVQAMVMASADWVWKVVQKELSHVALRQLRNVGAESDVSMLIAAAEGMPLTPQAYVEGSAQDELDTSAFDALWRGLRARMKQSAATVAMESRLPQKGEVIKAIRSKSYASETYPDLEAMGAFTFIAQTIIKAINRGREQAIEAGQEYEMDSSEIADWLAKRDVYTPPSTRKAVGKLEETDLSSFEKEFDSAPVLVPAPAPAPASAPATE